jgi:hypothetical protein
MTTNKAGLGIAYVAEHAQAIRLVSAGLALAIALLLIITVPLSFAAGGWEFGTVILMLVVTRLATWSLLVRHYRRGKSDQRAEIRS